MKYYLTTPIYYVNAAPHIGHTYTTLAADTIKRFRRMQGYDAVLTTGTDEHGQKVERSAQATGKTPEEFTAIVSNEYRELWDRIGIQYDHFIRTTEKRHHETVRWLFNRCLERGYIYKGSYTGQYCVSCELYVNDAKAGDPCPDCGRPTETVTEENYFFKLSAFTERLLKHYDDNPDFIQPESRRNEVLSFVRGGLQDLSISRTTIKWGIPLEGKHVAYVWFDALTNYVSAVGGAEGANGPLWPADLHLIGKEILRFHGVFWPAFLMAGDVALPKKIFAHGFLLFENDKMSKSRGNIVRTDPIREVVGIEALRYFLFREVVFGQDGAFSYDALVGRYNAELANGLGNLASRTLTMIKQYRDGVIPQPANSENALAAAARTAIDQASRAFDAFEFSKGLEAIWTMLSAADKFIVEQAPWKLAKQAESQNQLDDALYSSAEVLRIAVALLHPVLPESTAKIWEQLGMTAPVDKVELAKLDWGQLAPEQKIGQIGPVFPRIDTKSAVERMRELEQKETERQAKLLGKEVKTEAAAPAAAPSPDGKIAIDDFVKVDLRVGQVISAEPVPKADKLLHMKIDIGEAEPRTIVAGIAEAYRPEQMVGRKVVIVANLAPRKLRGIESNGMIVAASVDGGKPVLAGFLEEIPVGARLK
ncbi:MAG: methionine--tRNA ligase [Acidobacteriota bacterium]|nr:methionine--tRNA ligase [Acidobacteriota bacterium]